VKHRLIAANPAELVTAPTPPPPVDRFLTRDEAARLLSHLNGQDRLFVEVLIYTGLRWSEAAALRGFRVDLMRRRLVVAESLRRDRTPKTPKTDAGTRTVPLTDSLVAGLSKHLAGRDLAGYVFTNTDGAPLQYTNWRRRVWVPAVAAAGLAEPLPTPHDCRHSFASWLAESGMGTRNMSALTGHSSPRALERYTHATESRMDDARRVLDADTRRALEGSG
jgi:integrase